MSGKGASKNADHHAIPTTIDDIDGASFEPHRQGESVFPVTTPYSAGGRVKKKAKSRANSDDEVRAPILELLARF